MATLKLSDEEINSPTKRCSHCKKKKARSKFYKAPNRRGLQSWCITCQKERNRSTTTKYICEDCKNPFTRKSCAPSKKLQKANICQKCSIHRIMARNGGKTLNYTGSQFIPGSRIKAWMHSAKRRGHIWKLTKRDLDNKYIKQNGKCALSGIDMITTGNTPYKPSIDRIDSSKGYTRNNFQFVCSIINIMKNKIPEPTFIELCTKIAAYSDPSE